MRHTDEYEYRTNPSYITEEAYHHLSYAIFRTDADFGRVIATRFPTEPLPREGDILHRCLNLSDEAVAYLLAPGERDVPLFCLGEAGLGLLMKTYDAEAGLGLYLHIHSRPGPSVRLLCAGALGTPSGRSFRLSRRIMEMSEPLKRKDEESFDGLRDAWQAVQAGRGGLLAPPTRETGWLSPSTDAHGGAEITAITPDTLSERIQSMAAFAGCRVECRIAPETALAPVPLPRPLLLEALLLYLLTEIHTHAVESSATVKIGTVADPRSRWERRLSLLLSYRVDTLHMGIRVRDRLTETHRYLSDIANRSGLLMLNRKLIPPDLRALKSHKAEDYLFRQLVSLEWLTDPTVLPSSDLKTPLGFDVPEDRGF